MLHRIADCRIALDAPLFVVAEVGLNHGGSVAQALALIDGAAAAGASAVKLQTLTPDCLVSGVAPPPRHLSGGRDGGSLVEFFRRFELDETAHRELVGRARSHGLAVIATPLSEEAVDLLEVVGVDAYKIASGDITHEPLIERAGRTGYPLIISTGMSTLDEIAVAVECARSVGVQELALLHCVSCYPVPAGHENLRAIQELAQTFGVPVGLSDHGTDPMAAPLAVALGATIYERHIMLPGSADAVDAAVSSTPEELADIVRAAERARAALGDGHKRCLPIESVNRVGSRRSLRAARPLSPGEIIGPDDIVALRPGDGLESVYQTALVGCVVTRPIRAHEPFVAGDLRGLTGKVSHAV
jgi:N,N'-diacetyllegionaminate synthase